jgi:hypothetical protein
MTGVYRVDFRIPQGIAAGLVSLQVTAAWIPGSGVKIPVQLAVAPAIATSGDGVYTDLSLHSARPLWARR